MFYSNDFCIKKFGPDVILLGGGIDKDSQKNHIIEYYNNVDYGPQKIVFLKYIFWILQKEYIFHERLYNILCDYSYSLNPIIDTTNYNLDNYYKYSYEYKSILNFNTVYNDCHGIEMYIHKTRINCQEYINCLKLFFKQIFQLVNDIKISNNMYHHCFTQLGKAIRELEINGHTVLNKLQKYIEINILCIENKVFELKQSGIDMLNKMIHFRIRNDHQINIPAKKEQDAVCIVLDSINFMQKKKYNFLLNLRKKGIEMQENNLEKIMHQLSEKKAEIGSYLNIKQDSHILYDISQEKRSQDLVSIEEYKVFLQESIQSYHDFYKFYRSNYLTYQEFLNDNISFDKESKSLIVSYINKNEKESDLCFNKIVENFALFNQVVELYEEYSNIEC